MAGPTDYEALATQREQRGARGRAAAKLATGVAATTLTVAGATALVAPPFSTIASLGLAATGVAIAVVGAVRKRETRILRGDASTIAGFARRVARWSPRKRARVAERLLRERAHHLRRRKRTQAWKIRQNLLEMKLAALFAVEAYARQAPHDPVVPGQADTTLDATQDLPDDGGGMDTDYTWWVVGGGALIALAVVARRSRKAA